MTRFWWVVVAIGCGIGIVGGVFIARGEFGRGLLYAAMAVVWIGCGLTWRRLERDT